jgi:hypothetical protein
MRLHPKRRASMDHRPGPNIARAPPMVPSRRATHRSPARVRMWEISIEATNVPATGVHSPGIRRIPHPAKNTDITVVLIGWGSLHKVALARTISAEPTTKRMRSKPMPGRPPANVEYRRRKMRPSGHYYIVMCEGEPIPQKELGSSLFRVLLCVCGEGLAGENYSSMIPLFMPIMAACVRSLAPNLERMDLTRLLTVSSVILS